MSRRCPLSAFTLAQKRLRVRIQYGDGSSGPFASGRRRIYFFWPLPTFARTLRHSSGDCSLRYRRCRFVRHPLSRFSNFSKPQAYPDGFTSRESKAANTNGRHRLPLCVVSEFCRKRCWTRKICGERIFPNWTRLPGSCLKTAVNSWARDKSPVLPMWKSPPQSRAIMDLSHSNPACTGHGRPS
jgi:hypothetical protein